MKKETRSTSSGQASNFLKRVKISFVGLASAFKEEENFKILFIIALVVGTLMMLFGLSSTEKSILILTMLLVLGLELINSQIEKFLDVIEPNHHPKVKMIKDFSAGAVLLSVIGSVIIGVLIFWPHIIIM